MHAPRGTAEPGVLDAAVLRRAVTVLCLTEITSWGVLYYAFQVLTSAIAGAVGVPTSVAAGHGATALVAAQDGTEHLPAVKPSRSTTTVDRGSPCGCCPARC